MEIIVTLTLVKRPVRIISGPNPVRILSVIPNWPEDLRIGVPIGITKCLGCRQKMTIATLRFIIRNLDTCAIKRIVGYTHPDNRRGGCRDIAEQKILRTLGDDEFLNITQIR